MSKYSGKDVHFYSGTYFSHFWMRPCLSARWLVRPLVTLLKFAELMAAKRRKEEGGRRNGKTGKK